jgi:modification methylase
MDNMPEAEYQQWMIDVLNELYRILKDDGVLLFNHYDRHIDDALYSPLEFILRSQWQRPHRKIVLERPTTCNQHPVVPQTHEYMYVLTKGGKHGPSRPHWDKSRLPSGYKGSVWKMQSSKRILDEGIDHPCPFDMEVTRMLLRCVTQPGDTVLDLFAGSGSTLLAAEELGCNFIGVDISEKYRGIWAARAEAQRSRAEARRA